MKVWYARLRGLFGAARSERELEDEVRLHLEMQAEDFRRSGMSPVEAHYAALRSFGGVAPMKEEYRQVRSFSWVAAVIQDLSVGVRLLLRKPGFTLAAALSLALGIGVTTAIFTVLDAVALSPLPYADADRLVWMTQVLKASSTDEVTLTAHFLEWRRQNQTFVDLAGINYQARNLTGANEATQVNTARASESLLPLLQVQPVLGRNFLKQEDYKGHESVALLMHGFWQRRFGGDPQIVGKAITLDGAPYTVVGILPPDFVFPGPDQVQVITPLGKDEAAELQYKVGSIIRNVVGRLKPGVTFPQAQAELTVIQSRLPVPPFRPTITLKMLSLRSYLYGDVTKAGVVLVAAAGFLLLIACANVSNLLLARWMGRDRELAIRAALGASRARLVAQLSNESALLGMLACGAGAVLAFWARRPLMALSPARLFAFDRLPFDGRVLAFAVGLGMLSTMLFGLLPAFRATAKARAGDERRSTRLLSVIASAEIAITLVLSAGAGLMLQSFWKIRYQNLGFQPDHLVAATLSLPAAAYPDSARRSAFAQELLDRAQSIPGVEAAALTRASEIPPGEFHATNVFLIDGRDTPMGGARPVSRYPVVSSGFFTMMGIPLLTGRLLQDADAENASPVVVVNQALVKRYFPNEDPLGKRVKTGGDDQPWRTIAGVVGDVKTSGLAIAAEPSMYMPYRQVGAAAEIGILMRSPLAAGTIAGEFRKMVTAMDSHQPVANVQAMDDRLSASVAGPRFTAVLLFGFAGLAVMLGLIGVYGVMACRVRWQLRELAVRQALGAQPRDVVWHVLRQGAAMVLPGLAVGVLGALALGRLLAGMLYGISPRDPLTLGSVAAGLVVVALLACWIPARRAAGADPMHALRHD